MLVRACIITFIGLWLTYVHVRSTNDKAMTKQHAFSGIVRTQETRSSSTPLQGMRDAFLGGWISLHLALCFVCTLGDLVLWDEGDVNAAKW